MSERTITYLTDVSLLTVVVQSGHGESVLKAARDVGATTGAVGHHAKGIGARERLGLLGIAVETEKDVISLFVPSEQCDIVLDHLYRAADLDTPGKGYIYLTPVEKVAAYIPESMKARLAEGR
jgi:nitrogen regulatory protein PII